MWSFFLILSFESVNKLLPCVGAVFLSVVKAKQKQLLWPITTDTNNTMNQSEGQANTCNRCQARNDCEHVGIGLVSLLIGWESGAVFLFVFYQPQSKVRQNQSKCKLLSTVNWKLLYSGLDFSTAKHAFTPYLCSWVSINLHLPEFFSLTLSSEVFKWKTASHLCFISGINGTGKGQKQHKHIGVFWADHHCIITTLHVAVDECQPPLGSCITPALPLFWLQKSSSISPHTWHTALFYFRWILLTYCSVCHSSTRNLTKLVLFFTWLRNVFCCLISCGAVMFTTYTPGTSPRMLLSVFLMEFSL